MEANWTGRPLIGKAGVQIARPGAGFVARSEVELGRRGSWMSIYGLGVAPGGFCWSRCSSVVSWIATFKPARFDNAAESLRKEKLLDSAHSFDNSYAVLILSVCGTHFPSRRSRCYTAPMP
jgi:hypothetical protein